MRLILVRHGECEVVPGLDSSSEEGPLTEYGRRQAEALGRVLLETADRGETFEGVYSSPRRPARETSEVIAGILKLPAPEPREELSGLTDDLVSEEAGLEGLEAIQERAWRLVDELRQRHGERSSVIVVTNERVVRTLVCRALSMPLTELWRFALDPASLSTLEFRTQPRERTLLANLNETCHLE